jgi:ankyrin repeat protein
MRLLFEYKDIDTDSKDNIDRTLLLLAAEKWYQEIVKLLIEHGGVDPDSKDSLYDRTLLL